MEEKATDVPLPKRGLLVGLIYNTKTGKQGAAPDAEAEYDSLDTVDAICRALEKKGCRTVRFEADETLPAALAKTPVDIVFNIAEGLRGRGREAEVPALLNLFNIPFTGSDETALCLALDKALCKRTLSAAGIRTPRFAVISDRTELPALDALSCPVIVKPNAEGSSKGILDACVAPTPEKLRELVLGGLSRYGEPMLAEEYVEGREFTVGLLGNGKDVRVFAPMEIAFSEKTDWDYRVYSFGVKQDYKKYIEYRCPAPLAPETEAEMRAFAKDAFLLLGCRDFCRVDFRLAQDGTLYFIEMNPLPGLAPGYSDYPMLAEFCGVGYDELVGAVLSAALLRLRGEEPR